ncbi:MAG: transposase zinc-binding domain-containing protein [Nitrospirota bacterium]|nr:transposase zinc-binding domain-containing protein [Nitrospirota bacterium]
MITLASIIKTFASEFMRQYQNTILPSQGRALAVMQDCRSSQSPHLLAQCEGCDKQVFMPHSCGHRNCPHCQSHESQQWLERQLKKQVPTDYFLITFTVPQSLRSLVWQHQKLLYDMMLACVWQTVKDFAKNDKRLQGIAGAIAVLHIHSRRLDFHPHVHLVMPAGVIDQKKGLWRTKEQDGKKHYLFNHKALAKVFRTKLLTAIAKAGLKRPKCAGLPRTLSLQGCHSRKRHCGLQRRQRELSLSGQQE